MRKSIAIVAVVLFLTGTAYASCDCQYVQSEIFFSVFDYYRTVDGALVYDSTALVTETIYVDCCGDTASTQTVNVTCVDFSNCMAADLWLRGPTTY